MQFLDNTAHIETMRSFVDFCCSISLAMEMGTHNAEESHPGHSVQIARKGGTTIVFQGSYFALIPVK